MKRTLTALAVAASVLLVPAAAQAYPAPPVEAPVVSNLNPEPGEPITLGYSGLEGAAEAVLTVTSVDPSIPDSAIEIAGVQALAKPVSEGNVEFTVTLNEPGEYTSELVTDNGIVVPGQIITVADTGGGGTGDGSGSGSGNEAGGGGGSLPETGAMNPAGLAAIAGGLLIAGGAGLYFVRRARTQA